MKEKLLQAFGNLADSVIAVVPKIVVGILLVMAALLVAKLLEKLLRLALTKVRFDELVGKAGVDRALQRLGIRQELTTLFSRTSWFFCSLPGLREMPSAWPLFQALSGHFSRICQTSSRRSCC